MGFQRDDKMLEKPSCNKLSKLTTLTFALIAIVTAAALAPMIYTAVAAPVSPYGFGIALFKNVDPWGSTANEIILKRYGIPYDIYNSTDIGTVDLSKYAKVIISSDQNQVFYDAVNASRTWFEDYAENGGVLEIHAASSGWNGGNWIDDLPGNITYTSSSQNIINIVMKHHPLVRTPNNITDPELDNWGTSVHGYFTAYPSETIVILRESSSTNPAYIEVPFGSGVILASSQTLEYGYKNYRSFFLENSLLYLAPHENLDMQVNVGTVHFRGEIAEFYVTTTLNGNAVNASVWEATLYTEGGTTQADLLPSLAVITVGLYRISYTIPTSAVTGTYTLSVKASYRTGMTTATGHATASFIISPTLTSQNSYITEVKDKIATVIIPDLGTIKTDLNEINAKVVDIDGNVATIQTDIGTMKTHVSNIDEIVTDLRDNTTTIGNTTTNTYWFSIAAAILAAVAAVAAMLILVLVRKKPKP
jgi:hypothetical protein